jgi:hypothetical protein
MAAAYPAWMSQKTKNWTISGGFALNVGAGIKGGVKLWHFKHGDLVKSYKFLYVETGAGMSFGASFSNFLDLMGTVTGKAADAVGGNPLSIQGLEKIKVKSAFSYLDVMGAVGGMFSAGVTAVGAVEVKIFRVVTGSGTLLEVDSPAVEIKPGVDINVMSLTAGTFCAFDKVFWDANTKAYEQAKFDRIMNTPPSQNWDFGSKL